MLCDFPDEWIVGLAQDWLNPREQRRLAIASKRFHRILPQPLRIQICSAKSGGSSDCCCLAGELFATPVQEQHRPPELLPIQQPQACAATVDKKPDKRRTRKPALGPLDTSGSLRYHQEYFLWQFDYEENCPVYLGRQLRHTQPPSLTDITNNNENNNSNETSRSSDYRFTLGFRPRSPNQSWKILPDNSYSYGDHLDTNIKTLSSRKSSLSVVDPRRPLILVVSGWEERPGQVESNEVHKLMAQVRLTHTGRPLWTWHTVSYDMDKNTAQPRECAGAEGAVQDLSFAYTTSHLVRQQQQRPESELFVLFSSTGTGGNGNAVATASPPLKPMPGDRRRKRSQSGDFTQIYRLETFAIPDLSDRGAYLLYSPLRWKANLAPSTLLHRPSSSLASQLAAPHWFEHGRIASVEFSFWVDKGILYFKAHSLSFALAIPVVKLDREFFDASSSLSENKDEHPESQPIINLFESYSARWGCIKYYMATAADVGEGCAFNLDVFLRGVTDHEDHQVEQVDDVIAIQMKEASTVVDPSLVMDVQRDDSRIWKFFFSW
jgi:hypothetical protein